MQTGPHVQSGYDLALTELIGAGEHRFVVNTVSEAGREILAELEQRMATTTCICRSKSSTWFKYESHG
jgi:hypothetical protein